MRALICPMDWDMDFQPGRSLHIHNSLCKNIIVLVFVVMFMLPSILINVSLPPLSHSPPKLSLIFSKYLSLASTRIGSEHLSMKWALAVISRNTLRRRLNPVCSAGYF